jgi:type VI protein secretion system component Hcp
MPVPAYMTIEGSSQGDISGGVCTTDSIGTLSKSSDEFDKITSELFQVISFDGVEAISELFRFDINLSTLMVRTSWCAVTKTVN